MQSSLFRLPFPGNAVRRIYERFIGRNSDVIPAPGHPAEEQLFYLNVLRHELRTPLTGILGMSEILRGSGLNREQRLLLLALEESALQMNHLVGDLGISGNPSANGVTPCVRSFGAMRFMEGIVRAHWPAAHAKGIDLHLLIDRQLPANWSSDLRCLRQILDNLLANAVKFTQHGYVLLEARPAGEPEVGSRGVELRVTDTGPGIASRDRHRIYAVHERGSNHPGEGVGGSGFGLAVCRHLARRLGASLEHEPGSGGGVRFIVTLPRACGSDDAMSSDFQPKLLKSQRCLIVLADPARSVVENALGRMGIDTECTGSWQPCDGATAFDAVLCDSVQAGDWGWKEQGGTKRGRPLLLWRETEHQPPAPGTSCGFQRIELPRPLLHSSLEPLMLQLALQRKLAQSGLQ